MVVGRRWLPMAVVNRRRLLMAVVSGGDHLSEKMEAADTTKMENKVVQTFQKSFVQAQSILDQNRVIINEINQNHESKIPDNLSRNVGLIKELNNNIHRVVDLYADLSSSFAKSIDSDNNSSGAKKRFGSG